jgi:hypothetical protein
MLSTEPLYICAGSDEGLGCGFVDRESEFDKTPEGLTCPICHKEETVFLVAPEVKLNDADVIFVALYRAVHGL